MCNILAINTQIQKKDQKRIKENQISADNINEGYNTKQRGPVMILDYTHKHDGILENKLIVIERDNLNFAINFIKANKRHNAIPKFTSANYLKIGSIGLSGLKLDLQRVLAEVLKIDQK